MRLTMDDRRSVVRKAIAARFDGPEKELKAKKEAFARRLYDVAFSKKVREWAATAPKGWLFTDTCLRFNLSGHSIRITIDPGLPVPYSQNCGRHVVDNPEMRDEYTALDKAEDTLKVERQAAEAQVAALLNRVSALNRLREIWPEGEPFYAHLSPKERVDVPAIQVADINSLLGIGQ